MTIEEQRAQIIVLEEKLYSSLYGLLISTTMLQLRQSDEAIKVFGKAKTLHLKTAIDELCNQRSRVFFPRTQRTGVEL